MAELDDKVVCTKSKIEDVADAIRYKLGESDKYTLDEMPDKVRSISGGGSAVIESLSITQNGTYTATGNVDGYSPITVAVVPDLEDITITQNGTYTSQSHDGFDEVTVNVSASANLQTLNVTQNGTYTPTSPVDGYDEVVVNVAEPSSKVVSEFDFSQGDYDLTRSIIRTAPDISSYILGAPYNASVSNDEMVFNTTGQGYFHPSYYLNDFKDYEIEISFGTVDNSLGGWELGGFKIYGQNFSVWLNYENNVLTAFNSSGNFQIPNRTLADFSNKTIKFLVTHKISTITGDTLTEVSLLFEGETTAIKLGDVDNKLPYYPYIGSLSGNAIRGIAIKSMKITESKWELEPSSRALSEEPSNEEPSNEEQR